MFIGKVLNSVVSRLPFPKRDEDNPVEADELAEIVAEVSGSDVSTGSQEPVPAASGENIGKDKDIDRFFTKMNSTAYPLEVEAKITDILKLVVAEEKPRAEEKSKTVEKAKEPAVKAGEDNKDKSGLLSSLFEPDEAEENSAIVNLIASLPDVAVEELIGGANEVKSLIAGRKAKEKARE
jgi:hypothetical protein